MNSVIDALTAEWKTWCAREGLPCESADELLLLPTLTEEQRRYVSTYLLRWQDAEGR